MFRSRWSGQDELWAVMADDVLYASRPTRDEAVAVMEEQRDLVRKFGDHVRVTRLVAPIRSRPVPWRRRKMRALMRRVGNPDLKVKGWRRRRSGLRALERYERREGRLFPSATDDR